MYPEYHVERHGEIRDEKQYHRLLDVLDQAIENDAKNEFVLRLWELIKDYERKNPDVD